MCLIIEVENKTTPYTMCKQMGREKYLTRKHKHQRVPDSSLCCTFFFVPKYTLHGDKLKERKGARESQS